MESAMTLTRITLGLAFAACLLAGCAAPPRAEGGRVDQPIDSVLVRTQKDTGSFGSGQTTTTATRMAPRMWKGQQVAVFANNPGPTLYQLPPNGSFIGLFNGETPVMTFDPPAGYQWPLEVGKSWTAKYNMVLHQNNRVIPVEAKSTVEAYEDVTMPAGTFKTFRVRTSDNQGNENVNWFSPELGVFVKQKLTRTAASPSGPGTRETELVRQTIKAY
jgi:hypothetical protein